MWASVLLMYFWCMLLPLVGRAGSRTSHAAANFITVLLVLLVSIGCTGMATWRRKWRMHWGSWLWAGLLVLLLLLLLFGAFGV